MQYQAGSPWTLTVGGNVTVNSGGALSLPTSGDKLALGGAFSNAGTTTLGAGASLYGLGTFSNSNTTSIGNGATLTTLGAATPDAESLETAVVALYRNRDRRDAMIPAP